MRTKERRAWKILKYKCDCLRCPYQRAYNIFMEYWDNLPDEEKKDIDKRLKRCGL